ncbi:MAG TPA: glycosyltransferase family 2 protein [Azospirillaceae bacterium]|nr:glycosyltransferase family 2 protein [Azospirillaceae bacterium]
MAEILTAVVLILVGAQLYHYLGYPALLWALSRLFPRPMVAAASSRPRVSLILAAYNEAPIIAAKLENSLTLDYPDLEIVVVSDGSDDGTERVVAGFAGYGIISLHDPVRRGKGMAMNRAVAMATGDILVFSDANAFCAPEALARLVAPFCDPQVGLVSGRKTVRRFDAEGRPSALGQSDGLYWRYESLIKQWESRLDSTVSVVGELMAIRRALYAPVPPAVINDDAFQCLQTLRRGYRVLYEPAAMTWELPSATTREEVVRRRRMTAGRWQLLTGGGGWPWHRPMVAFFLFSHKFLRLMLPFGMIGALAANLALLAFPPLHPLLATLLAGQAVFYALAVAGLVGDRTGRHWRLPYLAYYLTESNLSALRGLAAFLKGSQAVTWQKAQRLAPPPADAN